MKHFIFDMGGVICKPIPAELIKDETSYIKCNNLEEEKIFLDSFIKFEKGDYTVEQYVNRWRPYFNKKDLTVKEFEENYYEIGNKYGGVFEDAYTLIKNVKDTNNKVYLLSNLHEIAYKDLLKVFDINIFDNLFLSFKMKKVKPNNDIFQQVINEIGDNPNNMYFFDDQLKNVKAAINNGMNAFLTTGETLEEKISIAANM